jgi:hypothetical protein
MTTIIVIVAVFVVGFILACVLASTRVKRLEEKVEYGIERYTEAERCWQAAEDELAMRTRGVQGKTTTLAHLQRDAMCKAKQAPEQEGK